MELCVSLKLAFIVIESKIRSVTDCHRSVSIDCWPVVAGMCVRQSIQKLASHVEPNFVHISTTQQIGTAHGSEKCSTNSTVRTEGLKAHLITN